MPDLWPQIQDAAATAFERDFGKDPDFLANEKCTSYLSEAQSLLESKKIRESARAMANGALCFGKLFRSTKYAAAAECMEKKDGAGCADILSGLSPALEFDLFEVIAHSPPQS